jgi:hypothetical protein
MSRDELLAYAIGIIELAGATGALVDGLTRQEAARLALAATDLRAAAPHHERALARAQSMAARKACPHEWEALLKVSVLELDKDHRDADGLPPHVDLAIATLRQALIVVADERATP